MPYTSRGRATWKGIDNPEGLSDANLTSFGRAMPRRAIRRAIGAGVCTLAMGSSSIEHLETRMLLVATGGPDARATSDGYGTGDDVVLFWNDVLPTR